MRLQAKQQGRLLARHQHKITATHNNCNIPERMQERLKLVPRLAVRIYLKRSCLKCLPNRKRGGQCENWSEAIFSPIAKANQLYVTITISRGNSVHWIREKNVDVIVREKKQ